ncbi:metal-dependent hydrolase [Candidatus Woesearchaeota archaeon]|nr:metal-dependent hydrolase [Candidatus Woesearchaeota archaeon]
MIFLTHFAFALLLGLLAIENFQVESGYGAFMAIVIISSLLPDIDCATSLFGRHAPAIERLFGHRKFFHSLLFVVMAAILVAALFQNPIFAFAALIGAGSHLLLDSLTPAGLYIFWPSNLIARGKIRTGSLIDYALFALFATLSILLLWAHSASQLSALF